MKSRFKFTKEGHVKFVGHLDTVRLFQRAIKASQLPIAYSQGFNPHSLVYFAMPLSVGVSSTSEYMDIVTTIDVEPSDMMAKLNSVLPVGIQITEAFKVEERGATLMSLVDEADYFIAIAKKDITSEVLHEMKTKLEANSILTMKKNKKKQISEVDLKPLIKSYEWSETASHYTLFVKVAAGSTQNLSPELLLKAITDSQCEQWDYSIERQALYTYKQENEVLSISQFGVINE